MTNNNPPPMPERIYVCRDDSPDDFLCTEHEVEGDTEYLRADLSRPRLTDEEVEGLKKGTFYMDAETAEYWEANGWNDCIDHLRQRGII